MCLFFPFLLALAAAVWALPVPLWVGIAWDAALALGLLVLLGRMRKAPRLQGVRVAALAGRPCPACGSTETQPWMSGRTPLGLHCQRCGRRTAGLG